MQNITTRKSFLVLFSIFIFIFSPHRSLHCCPCCTTAAPVSSAMGVGDYSGADIRFSGTVPGLTAQPPPPAVFRRTPPPPRSSLVIVWIRRPDPGDHHPCIYTLAPRPTQRQRPILTDRAFFLNPYICSRATIPLLTDPPR